MMKQLPFTNCLLAGAPKSTTEKLQWIMGGAARLGSSSPTLASLTVVSRTRGATSFTGLMSVSG